MCNDKKGCRGREREVCIEDLPSNGRHLAPKDAAGNLDWTRLDLDTPEWITAQFANNVPMRGRLVAVQGPVRAQPDLAETDCDQAGADLFLAHPGTWYVAYAAANGTAPVKIRRIPLPIITKEHDDDEVTNFEFSYASVTNSAARIVQAKSNRRFLLLNLLTAGAGPGAGQWVYVGNADVAAANFNGFRMVTQPAATSPEMTDRLKFGKHCPYPRYRGEFYAVASVAGPLVVAIAEGF